MSVAIRKLQRASAFAALPALANDTPPTHIEIFPAGAEINALDGRKFKNTAPEAVVAQFNKSRVMLAIDWEHSQDLRAKKGERSPAAGWITALEVRAGAIWAAVEWTVAGAADLISKAYRYISPTFFIDETGDVVSIEGAGLVNRPALDLPALASKQPLAESDIVDKKDLIKLLGLKDDATDAEVKAAVEANKAAAEAKAKAEADTKAANEAKTKAEADAKAAADKAAEADKQLQAARAGGADLSKVVPRSEYDAMAERVKTLETAATKRTVDDRNATVDRELDEATSQGKIAPADRDFYKQSCATEEGLAAFRKHIASKAPSQIVSDPLKGREVPKGSGDGGDLTVKDISAEQRTVLAKAGISEEEYLKSENKRRKQMASAQS